MGTYDQTVVKKSLSPVVRTNGTANGTSVDRSVNGGMQDAVFIIQTGTVVDGSHAVAIEDSADGSTGWANVAADQLQGAVPTIVAADDDKVFEVGVRSSRQHLRVSVVTTGATTGATFGALVVLGSPRFAPVSHA